MVPIHDTDLGTERWNKTQWNHFALWETIEIQKRKQRWMWVGITSFLFLILSAIPIVMLTSPKWITRSYATLMAIQINEVKQLAIMHQKPISLRFTDFSKKTFQIVSSSQCMQPPFQDIKSGALFFPPFLQKIMALLIQKETFLLHPLEAEKIGIFHLSDTFCFDPLEGAFYPSSEALLGFAFSTEPLPLGLLPDEKGTDDFFQQLSITQMSSLSAMIDFD